MHPKIKTINLLSIMATKIRLQRRGKKGRPYYHIVIADGRAPRDGRFVEKIGVYNPVANPAEVDLNFERAIYWLQSGAQPTDTVRSIFSFKGVLYKNHLLNGVKKGALTEEQAEARFQSWLNEKEDKYRNKAKEILLTGKEDKKKQLEAERKVKEAREKELAKKRAAELGKVAEAEASEASPETEATPEPEAIAEPEAAPEAAPEPEAVAEPETAPEAESTAEPPVAEEPAPENTEEEKKEE